VATVLVALAADEATASVEADVERSRKAGRAYGEDYDDFDDHRRRGRKQRSRFMDIFDF
jgi:hypothetical protein